MGCCSSHHSTGMENNISPELCYVDFIERLDMLVAAYEAGLLTESQIIYEVPSRSDGEKFLSHRQLKQIVNLNLYGLTRALVKANYVRLDPHHWENLREEGFFA